MRQALELALEALQDRTSLMKWQIARDAVKEALAQPEFTKHEVENADDWSEWVCPDAKGYLMKCCDCGLVHEAEFGVVRYKSETEREACDFVDDPNLQAVFRMRRSEQWSPEDTAHRARGLPMAQPEQEPVAYLCENAVGHKYFRWKKPSSAYKPVALYTIPPPCPTCEALARTVMMDQTGRDA